jgi:hypothetical protein
MGDTQLDTGRGSLEVKEGLSRDVQGRRVGKDTLLAYPSPPCRGDSGPCSVPACGVHSFDGKPFPVSECVCVWHSGGCYYSDSGSYPGSNRSAWQCALFLPSIHSPSSSTPHGGETDSEAK